MAPTGSAEKRAREEAEAAEVSAPETRRAKRRRWDDGDALAAPPTAPPAIPPPHPPGASAAAPAKPALPNVDALAKAKAVLQKQKELAAKLASVPKLANPAAAPSGADAARKTALARALEVAAAAKSAKPAAATASAAPRALRLNAAGEEIDEDGNVIVAKVREVSTFKVNEKTNKLEEFAALERAAEAEAAAEADDLAWMDPRMGAAGRRRQRKGGFQVRERFPCPSRLDAIVRLGSGSPLWFSVRILSKPCGRRLGGPHRRGDYSDAKSYFVSVARRESGCCPDRASRRWHIFPRRDSLDGRPGSIRKLHSVARTPPFSLQFLCLRQRNLFGSWRRGIPHERNPLPSGQHLLGSAIFPRRARSSFPPRTRLGSPRPVGG